jgi:alkanesulfonate monooxygenase SsuD/methylene tetrahydromethanopterin reductase-like flavin-dependent oxidoreductase (luciferase family)
MPERRVWFGVSTGQWNGADVAASGETIPLVSQADRDGLDLFTVADHPYFGDKLDSYALLGFVLGRTERICGAVTVTNLPCRPAPVLARTITSLSALSGGRVVLGVGAGAMWDMALPRVPPAHRCGCGRGRQGSRGDHRRLQLRRSDHSRADQRHP